MNFLPSLVFAATLSNSLYLFLISLLPSMQLQAGMIVGLRVLALGAVWWGLRKYWPQMAARWEWSKLLPFAAYPLILLLRFPLIYPTYDDLAVHFVWGDYANRMWQNSNFLPLEFLNYFYLPYDMNYTPFLYTVGVRLTVALFFVVTTVWLASLFLRFRQLLSSNVQKWALSLLFALLPFIPHMMAIQGTLMLEYFTLPFVLEALYQVKRPGRDRTMAAIAITVAVIVKQSHALFVILPLGYLLLREWRRVKWYLPSIIAAIAGGYFVRLWLETGNPLGGLFNAVFKSPLYPLVNFTQPLFGPESVWESLVWPVIGQFSERYAEGIVSPFAKIVFAPIPILGYLGAIALMIKKRSILFGLVGLSYLLWAQLVGYARYYLALNALSGVLLVIELGKYTPPGWLRSTKLRTGVLLGLMVLSLSSLKTDFSWRPNLSVRTPSANAYYLGKYREGLALVAKDTVVNMARAQAELFAGYDGVVTVYRGPATMLSYLGYLNEKRVAVAVTPERYREVIVSKRVSSRLKDNLAMSMRERRVLMIVDNSYKPYMTEWENDRHYACRELGPAPADPYFQRPDYYGETSLYECAGEEVR